VTEFLGRCAIFLIEATRNWSQAARTRVANVLGDLFWLLVFPRRRITLINLRACFPQWTEARRREVARNTFRNIARGMLDHSVLTRGSREAIAAYVEADGLEHLHDPANRPLLMVVPHFVGLHAGGMRLAMELQAAGMYARQRNRALNDWLHKMRGRFNEPLLIPREGFDLRVSLRAIKDGLPFYYLPDQDYGRQHSIFVPFFGVQAATIPMVARLAKMTGAKVVTLVAEMTPQGYRLHFGSPWRDFPSGDVEADTARMNHEIERWVERLPDQYLWTHRRFKTRPEGQPSMY
jgi:KDO2-lipid IV(A) lauroyltransferase